VVFPKYNQTFESLRQTGHLLTFPRFGTSLIYRFVTVYVTLFTDESQAWKQSMLAPLKPTPNIDRGVVLGTIDSLVPRITIKKIAFVRNILY
jgi:hypothetical protein